MRKSVKPDLRNGGKTVSFLAHMWFAAARYNAMNFIAARADDCGKNARLCKAAFKPGARRRARRGDKVDLSKQVSDDRSQ